MADLSNNIIEAQRQVLSAIKAGMETIPGMGIVHTVDRQVKNLNQYKDKILKFSDPVRNKTLLRGAFITFQGPDASTSGTLNRTPPKCLYKIYIIWEFEDDTYNSTPDFSDMMMRFYEYFETNHTLGFRGLTLAAPELTETADVVPFNNMYVHRVEFLLTCSLYAR